MKVIFKIERYFGWALKIFIIIYVYACVCGSRGNQRRCVLVTLEL